VGHDLVDNALPAFNTIPGVAPGASDVDSIKVVFTAPIAAANLQSLKPFLIVDRSRGKELREMDVAPTPLMDTKYFGSGLDDSDPANGSYYRSKTDLPWVLNIPGTFRYPYEQVDITDGYHNFVSWFQTSGAQHADWYDTSDPANIDGSKLYPQR
jgi:LruC domain-containing protein